MKNKTLTPNSKFYYAGLICGILAILCCFVTIGFSAANSYISVYTLALSLIFLSLNCIGLHLGNQKRTLIGYISLGLIIFGLAVLESFTKYGIYFLITSMFGFSLTIIFDRALRIKKDHSLQSIIRNSLSIVFFFLFSFVFFFPAIYEKHATSVSNSNFIVLCYSIAIIISSSKNILFPYNKTLKLDVLTNIFRKSLVSEILLGLLILIILCSVYFTVVEPSMTSYVDSLWYSFALVTTIGFGDVSVSTTFGRILSVILGINGIVVVALFTSIIVNFYNEMNKKRQDKEMKDILNKVEEIEKIENEKSKHN